MHQPNYLTRLVVCCALLAANLHAELATSPLTTQSWVAPNVIVTLDDSPSMNEECIPSDLCIDGNLKVDFKVLGFSSVMRYLKYDNLNNSANAKAIAGIPYGDNPVFGGVTTYDGNLLAAQMRSASTNPTYYNPRKLYVPWPSQGGLNFANADPKKAYYDPSDPRITHSAQANAVWTTSSDLPTIDLTAELTMPLNICSTALLAQCNSSTPTFKPAQYFNKLDSGDGTQLSDFTQVVISASGNPNFNKSPNRTDCRGNRCTQAEELQNFANWYSYYMPGMSAGVLTYDANNLLARQMRSASNNSAYYSPQRRYMPWLKADGTYYPQASTQRARYDPNDASETLDLSQQITASTKFCTALAWSKCPPKSETFYPAQYYIKRDGTDGTSTDHYTQVIINTGSSFTKYAARTDCAAGVCTRAEELQNFANWFTYYRTKWLTAKAVISQTFKAIPGEVRLGYGTISKNINNNLIDGELTGVLERGVRPFNDTGVNNTARSDFYNWLLNLNFTTNGAGTPLRRAMIEVGNYYMRNDNAGPWAEMPGGSDTTAHKVCRRALHLLITDGAWTDEDASRLTNVKTGPGNRSVATGTLLNVNVDGSYPPPFKDSSANTLADVAMYYWKTNLRSDLTGTVTPPQSEKDLGRNATWPHMVNYTIGFGVNGTLRNPQDSAALTNGTASWPPITSDASKIDDMWHAAWNSGGKSFNAIDPGSLSVSLAEVIESMKEQVGSDAPLILPSRFVTSNFVYIPSYKSKTWSGDLLAYAFDRNTGDRLKDSDGKYADASWSAASRLKLMSAENRNIFTFDGSNRFEFTYASLNAQGLVSRLTANSAKAEDLINYLRGDSTFEGTEGTSYRARPDGKLGDIVNSPPLLVSDGEDASYDFLKPPASGGTRGNYRQFLLDKKKRKGLVFVGANDGMLHAFDAVNGDEKFAYIPKTVLGDLYRLSATGYVHRYYVDGPLVEADVYDTRVTPSDSDTAWRNIVVGTGGAGARNIFAINVPVRSNGNSNTAYPPVANDIWWEVNNNDPGFAELGHVLQKPEVGMMRDGRWVVVVGNGYDNGNGKAKLFIINAITGALIKSLEVNTTGINGLGGVRLVLDLERQITAAYAGDLQGNLWKFDFSSGNSNDWGVGFGGKPLFQAKYNNVTTQPITAAPLYLAHPQGGNLVVFGTGKLFEVADQSNTEKQTLYAVWDRVLAGQPSGIQAATDYIDTPMASAMVSRSKLVGQSMSAISGTNFYSATNYLVNYPSNRGWFIDLDMNPPGLRMVFAPQMAIGKVFLQTLAPPGSTTDPCAELRGKSVSFIVNPFTGSASAPTFDVNADGKIDAADASYASNAVNAVAVASDDMSGATFSHKVGSGANIAVLTTAFAQRTVAGAQKSALRRTWRQIINRPRPVAVATSGVGN